MSARRCSSDDVNWPNADKFERCPLCGEPTWKTDEQPLSPQAAAELVEQHKIRRERYRDFEAYYAERERLAAERSSLAVVAPLAEPPTQVLTPVEGSATLRVRARSLFRRRR